MQMLLESTIFCTQQVARQSGREASAGGHHGGPRGAKRRSHTDSLGSGVDPTLCMVETAADSRSGTTADGSSHSDAGGGAVEARGSSSKDAFLVHTQIDKCIHAGRSFFPPIKKGFFERKRS
jgi:hypothetical protein